MSRLTGNLVSEFSIENWPWQCLLCGCTSDAAVLDELPDSIAACHPQSRTEQEFALAVIHSRERLGKGT